MTVDPVFGSLFGLCLIWTAVELRQLRLESRRVDELTDDEAVPRRHVHRPRHRRPKRIEIKK